MDIRLLRAFVTLAQQGRYHAAAQKLCLTQPALTKQIQTLEHLTGMALFERGRHGATLTHAGQLLLPGAGELLKHYEAFRDYARNVQQGCAGALAVGFGISTFKLAPALVKAFHEQYPAVDIALNDIPSSEQCRMLLSGELHIGFVRLPVSSPLMSHAVLEENLVLAIPAGAAIDPINISATLQRYPLLQITPARGPGLSKQSRDYLKQNQLSPLTPANADDIHTLLALVAAGNGVALLPAGARHIIPTGVELQPLEGQEVSWQVGMAWNPHFPHQLRDRFINSVAPHLPSAESLAISRK